MKASSQDVVTPETPRPFHWQGRLASLLEVIGVFVVGSLTARQMSRGLALGSAKLRTLEPGVSPDFVQLSVSASTNLVLRYGLMLGLAFAIGWWHRRRRLSAYGVTTAGRSAHQHLGIGILLFATIGILPILLKLLADVLPMGPALQHWTLIESLQTPGVWLYLFVGSFGLVPIAEELLARGYVQTRLAEDFGPAAAILITAVFFTFSHTQYFIAGALAAGMLAALLIGSIAAGYVRHRTGSATGHYRARPWQFALPRLVRADHSRCAGVRRRLVGAADLPVCRPILARGHGSESGHSSRGRLHRARRRARADYVGSAALAVVRRTCTWSGRDARIPREAVAADFVPASARLVATGCAWHEVAEPPIRWATVGTSRMDEVRE